ncbi:hypothetical protein ACIBL6_23525 [Streptomyces sp. NPDC050400]|uniref:hypothetical protein n=1 Tax=Streptomyces sp. NPDC050400 TaxID=3365610 RepID=UPI00379AE6D4
MAGRQWAVAVWAGLCVAGIAATAALESPPSPGSSGHPDPSPSGTYAVDCEEIADGIEHERAADAARPTPEGKVEFKAYAVPEQCADVLERRGLK